MYFVPAPHSVFRTTGPIGGHASHSAAAASSVASSVASAKIAGKALPGTALIIALAFFCFP